MFTHIKQTGPEKLHISRLYQYISAYEMDSEEVEYLVELIEKGLHKAHRDTETVIVDRNGEMCFHCHPSGTITLMIPWKEFEIIRD